MILFLTFTSKMVYSQTPPSIINTLRIPLILDNKGEDGKRARNTLAMSTVKKELNTYKESGDIDDTNIDTEMLVSIEKEGFEQTLSLVMHRLLETKDDSAFYTSLAILEGIKVYFGKNTKEEKLADRIINLLWSFPDFIFPIDFIDVASILDSYRLPNIEERVRKRIFSLGKKHHILAHGIRDYSVDYDKGPSDISKLANIIIERNIRDDLPWCSEYEEGIFIGELCLSDDLADAGDYGDIFIIFKKDNHIRHGNNIGNKFPYISFYLVPSAEYKNCLVAILNEWVKLELTDKEYVMSEVRKIYTYAEFLANGCMDTDFVAKNRAVNGPKRKIRVNL